MGEEQEVVFVTRGVLAKSEGGDETEPHLNSVESGSRYTLRTQILLQRRECDEGHV